MTVTTREIDASREQVWSVLADGYSYAGWVVGAARIRDVDAGYPAVGKRVHHSVGPWPLMISDVTVVKDLRPLEMLLLNVRLWPIGHGLLRFELKPLPPGENGERTEVTMLEEPAGGPARWLYNPAVAGILHARNKETLQRLAWLAERGRSGVPDDHPTRPSAHE